MKEIWCHYCAEWVEEPDFEAHMNKALKTESKLEDIVNAMKTTCSYRERFIKEGSDNRIRR